MEMLAWATMISGWLVAWWFWRKWLSLSLTFWRDRRNTTAVIKDLESRLRYAKQAGGIDPADEEKGRVN